MKVALVHQDSGEIKPLWNTLVTVRC